MSRINEKTPDTSDRLMRAFIPSKLEIIILPLLSTLFLAVGNGMSYLRTIDGVSYMQVTDYASARFKEALKYLDQLVGSTVLTVIFWMFIGIIVYILLWFALSAYSAYKSDVPITKGMVVPKGASRSKLLHDAVIRFCVRIVAIALLGFWLYMFFAEIIPYSSDNLLEGVKEGLGIVPILHILWSVTCLSISTFIIFILARCIVMRDRVLAY